MKLTPTKTLRALLLSLPLFGAVALFAPSFASAQEAPIAVLDVDATSPVPSAPSEADEFAQREQSAQLDEFQGGDRVIITGSTLLLIVVVVLIVIIIL